MACEEEREELIRLAAELREILFDDASPITQGAMVGCPVECLAFAKWWIRRAKGIEPDEHNVFASSCAGNNGAAKPSGDDRRRKKFLELVADEVERLLSEKNRYRKALEILTVIEPCDCGCGRDAIVPDRKIHSRQPDNSKGKIMKFQRNGITVKISKKALLALAIAALSGTATTMPAPDGIPAVGEYWPGQGGINHGYFKGRDGERGYYLVAAIDDLGRFQWGKYGTEIEGADSKWDGKANTEAMVAAGCEPALKAKAYTADGHSDFYLAAHDEYHQMRANADERWKKEWYWTSTQANGHYAWAQHFDDGDSRNIHKYGECRARAVRRVYL